MTNSERHESAEGYGYRCLPPTMTVELFQTASTVHDGTMLDNFAEAQSQLCAPRDPDRL